MWLHACANEHMQVRVYMWACARMYVYVSTCLCMRAYAYEVVYVNVRTLLHVH